MKKNALYLSVFGLSIVSTGCPPGGGGEGGGGDDGGEESMIPDLPQVAFCQPVETWSATNEGFEEQVLAEVNDFRAGGGNCGGVQLPGPGPLDVNGNLWCAARVHALDMATVPRFMNDTGSNGSSPTERTLSADYDPENVGQADGVVVVQTVGIGYRNGKGVVDAWKRRPELCQRLLTPGLTDIGVGAVDQEEGIAWALVLGGPELPDGGGPP